MALTATATFPPSWDETIVPTLRKRLEIESRVLAKRISAASIGSDDAPSSYQYSTPHNNTQQSPHTQTHQSRYQRPSAIPRPSMQHSRPNETNGHVQSPPLSHKRPRTLSQPSPFESSRPPSESSASRSASPQSSKPSRIPMKNRNGSVSSNAQSNHTAATSYLNGRKSKDTYYAIDAIHEGPQHKPSAILNEKPPFTPNHVDTDVDSARLSSESEERPFEHWYRGDVSRNGGVGELRVAKRKEMLDIASYGYSTKRVSTWVEGGHARSTSGSGSIGDSPPQKRRAGSIGPSARESIYLDKEQAEDEDMVLDERPLTDVEDLDPDMEMSYYFQSRSSSPPPMPIASDLVAPPPRDASRIPTPSYARRSADPPRTPSPARLSSMARGASEPYPSGSSPVAQPSTPRARSQTPTKALGPQSPKSQGKSPARNTPSSSKTSSTGKKSSKAPPVAMRRAKEEEEKNRRSIAVYPTPDGEDMEHAIPVWMQPVENSNWDDVVLPVVARKRGLDGQYEMTDGTPKVKVRERVPEPAPGTFGYDYSKYKPPRMDYGETPEEIQIDEFGQQKESDRPPANQERPPMSLVIDDRRPIHPMQASPRSRPPSPAPFSHYSSRELPLSTQAEKLDVHPPQKAEDGGDGAGCCKCVIM